MEIRILPTKEATIELNLQAVRSRMADACARAGRATDGVRLIAVTKYVGQEEVDQLVALGVTDLAESRVHDARGKIETCTAEVCWHMIGSVQRRKAGDVVELFDAVDSVDRLELADRLEQRCAAAECVLPVLLQVNVSGEESKHGFQADELETVLSKMEAMPHLDVQGLMTMAPLMENAEAVRPYFAKLSSLADAFALPERSMGMTRDFEVAIEEGATQVRIGSALF